MRNNMLLYNWRLKKVILSTRKLKTYELIKECIFVLLLM